MPHADEEGCELPDVEAARAHAVGEALHMTSASVLEQRKINLHHRIEVADEKGEIILSVEFGDVLTLET